MQMYLSLNLLDNWPVHPHLQLSERPAPVHGLRVLAPMQEPRRLPAADAGGGRARALLRRKASPACEALASPGAVTGAQNRGGGAEREEEEDGGYSTERREESG